jgi:peptidoglycan/LPS O-acetylase OafA/YrhL
LDYFVYGAIPAYLLFSKPESLLSFVNGITAFWKWLWLAITIVSIVFTPHIPWSLFTLFEPSIFGLLFMSVLLIVIPEAPNQFKIANQNLFNRLGLFTYALYLFHTIVINLLSKIAVQLNIPLDTVSHALLFTVTALLITIGFSALSYYLFEKPFLKLKQRLL